MHNRLCNTFCNFPIVNYGHNLTLHLVTRDCSSVHVINGKVETITKACQLAAKLKLQMTIKQDSSDFFLTALNLLW